MSRGDHVDPQGRVWHPFDVQYTTSDGTYSVIIYALSFIHAEEMLMDLKDNATVCGQIM